MLELVGRLIGMSLRFELCLAFQFPTLIWKRLHGQEVTLEDLATVDLLTTQSIVAIRDCDQVCVCVNAGCAGGQRLLTHPRGNDNNILQVQGNGIPPVNDEEGFSQRFGKVFFVVNNHRGEPVSLVPGGSTIPVTFANRKTYAALAADLRLKEFDRHVRLQAQRHCLRRHVCSHRTFVAVPHSGGSHCQGLLCYHPTRCLGPVHRQ